MESSLLLPSYNEPERKEVGHYARAQVVFVCHVEQQPPDHRPTICCCFEFFEKFYSLRPHFFVEFVPCCRTSCEARETPLVCFAGVINVVFFEWQRRTLCHRELCFRPSRLLRFIEIITVVSLVIIAFTVIGPSSGALLCMWLLLQMMMTANNNATRRHLH